MKCGITYTLYDIKYIFPLVFEVDLISSVTLTFGLGVFSV